MIEDSEDKLRRNLVVFTAAILGTVFLQPKLAHNGQLLGFIETKDVDPLRMWGVITAILLYLTYRYWCSRARLMAWHSWLKDASEVANALLRPVLIEALYRQYAGEQPGGIIPVTHPPVDKSREPKHIKISFRDSVYRPKQEVSFSVTFSQGVNLGEGRATYDISGWRSRRLYGSAVVRAMVRTGAAAELCLPFVLALAAGIVCGVEVWRHWP